MTDNTTSGLDPVGWAYNDRKWDADRWHLCQEEPRPFDGRRIQKVYLESALSPSVIGDTAGLPSDYAGLVERLRTQARWTMASRGDLAALLVEAAEAIDALSRAPEAVGYITPDDIAELKEGRIGGHVYPKGTLRPENEIAVFATPPAPQPIGSGDILESCAALLEVFAEDAQKRNDTATWSTAAVMAENARAYLGPRELVALPKDTRRFKKLSGVDDDHTVPQPIGSELAETVHGEIVRIVKRLNSIKEPLVSPAPLPEPGMLLVPEEPTDDMIGAWMGACGPEEARRCYSDMLAARPKLEGGE